MNKIIALLVWAFYGCFALAQKEDVWLCPNVGQWQEEIIYKTKLYSGETYVLNDGIAFNFFDIDHHHHGTTTQKGIDNHGPKGHYLKMRFMGSSFKGKRSEKNSSSFYSNFYLGKDSRTWKSKVKSFQNTELEQVYPGINLKFSTENSGLKYEWVVAPMVNPSLIQIEIEGTNRVEIEKSGDLVLHHSLGTIRESAPFVYQLNGIEKRIISCKYKLTNQVLSYELGEYDNSKPLIIDPSLTFSTFSGSTADNWGSTATPGPDGSVFGGGVVFGSGLPATPGAYDISFNNPSSGTPHFDVSILKFNASGTDLLYCTYLGGVSNEFPSSMVSNANGELYVLGITSSADFPTNLGYSNLFSGGTAFTQYGLAFPGGSDIFISRFNPDGTALLNSTFIGGTDNDGVNIGALDYNLGDSYRGEINLDPAGNVYVASSTSSSNFPIVGVGGPTYSGIQSGVIFKMNAGVNLLLWSRYIAGNDIVVSTSLAIATNGNVYVAGGTSSTNLAMPGGVQTSYAGGQGDGFVLRLNGNSGTTMHGTYVGQGGYEQVYFVQLDPLNRVYVLGQTSTPFTITPGKYGNPNSGTFIRQMSQNLSTINWTTMIGAGQGEIEISPTAFLVSNCYRIYLSGWGGTLNASFGQASNSNTNGFPVTPDAYQSATNGSNFYIAVLESEAAELKYATYFGSLTSSSNHVDGGTSRFDKNGNIYHAVCAACGGNDNGFTTTPGVWSPTNPSPNCNLAVFKFELGIIKALVSVTDPLICDPEPVQFVNSTANANVYEWTFGDGNTSDLQSPTHQYPGPGSYNVRLIVRDSNNCFLPDTSFLVIEIGDFEANLLTPSTTICKGETFQLEVSGGKTYEWSPANLLNNPSIPNPLILGLESTTIFTVIVRDSCGIDTLDVIIGVYDETIVFPRDTSLCITLSANLTASGGEQYLWSPSTYLDDPTSASPLCTPLNPISYNLQITSSNGCIYNDDVEVLVRYGAPDPQIKDTAISCYYDTLEVQVGGADVYTWNRPILNHPTEDSIFYIPGFESGYFVCTFTNSCGSIEDSIFLISIRPEVQVVGDQIACFGDTVRFKSSGAESYLWQPSIEIQEILEDSVFAIVKRPLTYFVLGTDSYGCIDSASITVNVYPKALVQASASNYFVESGNSVELTARGNSPGGSYTWSPIENLSCPSCRVTEAFPKNGSTYTVLFVDENGCKATDDLSLNFNTLIYVPNAFTPDSDEFNEFFKVYGINLVEFTCEIYNRWGELIHTFTHEANAWDGTYKGEIVPQGVYTWKLRLKDNQGKIEERVGFVTVLK